MSTTTLSKLGQILIDSFRTLPSGERRLLSNNAFMVNLQIKQKFGEEVHAQVQSYGEAEWNLAWGEFDEYFEEQVERAKLKVDKIMAEIDGLSKDYVLTNEQKEELSVIKSKLSTFQWRMN